MRVRTLRTRNYRRLRDVVVEFPEGLIAVTGPNGAGKSTLIEAVAWCLFGHDAARTGKDLIKGAYAAPGDDVEVAVEFDLDGTPHRAARRLRGKSQQVEAQVEVDGALVVAPGANSADLATKYLCRALGTDRRGFHATVLANQGDLAALSHASAGERKRLILGLLGIDEVDAAIQEARSRKREVQGRLEEVRRAAERAAQLTARLAEVTRDEAAVSARRDVADVEAGQAAAALAQAEEQAASLLEARQLQRELRGRIDALQRTLQVREEQQVRLGAEVRMLEERRGRLDALHREGRRFHDLQQRLEALEAARVWVRQREELDRDGARLREELARWRNGHEPPPVDAWTGEVAGLRHRCEALREQRATRLHEADAAQREAAHLDAQAAAAQAKWREVADLGADAPCPVCARPLGEALERLEAHREEERAAVQERVAALAAARTTARTAAAQVEAELAEATAALEAAESRLAEGRRVVERDGVAREERQRIQSQLQVLETRRAALPARPAVLDQEAALVALAREQDAWRDEVTRLDAEASRLPAVRAQLDAVTAQVQGTRSEIGDVTRRLGAVTYEEGSWERADAQVRALRARVHAADRERDVLRERASNLAAQKAQVTGDLEALGDVASQRKDLERRARVGELLAADRGDDGLLPRFRRHLISRIRPALARVAGDLVAEMTGGRYRELVLDEDYTVSLYDGGTAWPLERFSGGERDVVNLALRLAVSELLARSRRARRLGFVALDEVLAGQDESRRANVLASLKALGAHFRQVLLVTHLEEARERVDHVIRVVPAADGTSRVACSWDAAA